MKKALIIILCFIGPLAFAQKYTVDVKASTLIWTGHAQTGVYSPKGTLQIKSGSLTIANGKVATGTVIVDMNSLKTDNAEMQEHLRGKDFFDIEKFPEAKLVMTGNGKAKLTIKGMTKPVVFELAVSDQHIKASATIDRTLFGIKYNSASYFQDLGSYAIRNTFEIEADLVYH